MIAEATAMVGELETSLGVPTFAFFAHWQGEYAVDADEEAARLLTTAIVDRVRRSGAGQVALVLGARGGYPAFADMVLRTLRQIDVDLQAVVACRVDGAVGTLAAASTTITIHPQAGIGALDRGLCVVPRRELDAALLSYWPGDPSELLPADENRQALFSRLAHDRMLRDEQRRMAHQVLRSAIAPKVKIGDGESSEGQGETTGEEEPSLEWLFESNLGRGGTVDTARLCEAGIKARVAPAPLAEQLEELLAWAGSTLHLFERPGDRFSVSSDFADEMEFEPASRVAAAAVVGIDAVWIHELDTGSPDPDAPRLLGRWRAWDPEGAGESAQGE